MSAGSEIPLEQNGLRETIVAGKRDKNVDRLHWTQTMKREGIESLDIYWYVTGSDNSADDPARLEERLLRKFRQIYGHLRNGTGANNWRSLSLIAQKTLSKYLMHWRFVF